MPYNSERTNRVVAGLVINPRTNPASAGRKTSSNGESRSGEEHQKSRLDVLDARLKRRDDVSPPTQLKTRDHEVLLG